MSWVFLAILLVLVAFALRQRIGLGKITGEGAALNGIEIVVLLLALISILSTSYVTIGPDEVVQLSRIYWARQMPSGHIIGLNGEKGPQAEILGPGFHFRFLLNVLNNVEKLKVVQIGSGQYGKLVALDGQPLPSGQTFASQVGSLNQMLDAQYFLTHGCQKGPQIL